MPRGVRAGGLEAAAMAMPRPHPHRVAMKPIQIVLPVFYCRRYRHKAAVPEPMLGLMLQFRRVVSSSLLETVQKFISKNELRRSS